MSCFLSLLQGLFSLINCSKCISRVILTITTLFLVQGASLSTIVNHKWYSCLKHQCLKFSQSLRPIRWRHFSLNTRARYLSLIGYKRWTFTVIVESQIGKSWVWYSCSLPSGLYTTKITSGECRRLFRTRYKRKCWRRSRGSLQCLNSSINLYRI